MGEEIDRTQLQIEEFAELAGLSVPQLCRYDGLRLLKSATRSADSRDRYYSPGQTGAARVIALRALTRPVSAGGGG